jgi:protein-S-isoprenylcysteine O-methyltransferase Ste14
VSGLPTLGRRGEGWLVVQLVLLIAVVAASFLLGPNLDGAPRFAAAVAGGVLMVGGLALVAAGARRLDRSLSALPWPRAGGALVDEGVYRRIRHPIYVGVIASALGWALFMASLAALVMVLLLGVLLDLKARREEAWLRDRYPDYADYQRRTRRFIPGLY